MRTTKFNVGDTVRVLEGSQKGEIGELFELRHFGWRILINGWLKYPFDDAILELVPTTSYGERLAVNLDTARG